MPKQAWTVELSCDEQGDVPVMEFTVKQRNPKIQAKIIKKMEYLRSQAESLGAENVGRPLVDTIDGDIKELRVDKQVRLLFSWQHDEGVILMLDGERKKNGKIDQALVERAKRSRQHWIKSKSVRTLQEAKAELG